VAVDPLICQPRILGELEASILLFFTGRTRSASVVLANGNGSWGPRAPDRRRLLRRMVGLAFDLKKELESGHLRNFGLILHENWCLKTQVTAGVSDPQIDDWYARGLASGALGGKLLGAGSGGFLMFFAPPERHLEIVKALSDLTRVTFGFDRAGAQIVFYQPSE
jgi:D-glycero-alpha-D-manno-heptose-7-phosphate kinase